MYRLRRHQQEEEQLAPAEDDEEEEEEESEYETDSEEEGFGRALLKPVFVPKVRIQCHVLRRGKRVLKPNRAYALTSVKSEPAAQSASGCNVRTLLQGHPSYITSSDQCMQQQTAVYPRSVSAVRTVSAAREAIRCGRR